MSIERPRASVKQLGIGPALVALGLLAGVGPAVAAGPVAASAALAAGLATAAPLVDINRASRRQLKTLPGIGDAQADRIVAGRPYGSKADLVATKVIPAGTYLAIRRLIVAVPDGHSNGR